MSGDRWGALDEASAGVWLDRNVNLDNGRYTMHAAKRHVAPQWAVDFPQALELGKGNITLRDDDEGHGGLHYTLLRAPIAGGEGLMDVLVVTEVYVHEHLQRRGAASAMYGELRASYQGVPIGADRRLTDGGRRLVTGYRSKHPDIHVGRMSMAGILHRTTGPDDAIYIPEWFTEAE